MAQWASQLPHTSRSGDSHPACEDVEQWWATLILESRYPAGFELYCLRSGVVHPRPGRMESLLDAGTTGSGLPTPDVELAHSSRVLALFPPDTQFYLAVQRHLVRLNGVSKLPRESDSLSVGLASHPGYTTAFFLILPGTGCRPPVILTRINIIK